MNKRRDILALLAALFAMNIDDEAVAPQVKVEAKAVRIIPSGAEAEPPPLEGAEIITEEDIERAIDKWNQWMPGLEGLLEAERRGR